MSPEVILLASTMLYNHPQEMKDDPTASSADFLAEIAGRNCYQSWDKPNPETATNIEYIGNILNHKHFSVLEHASATFLIFGISTSCLGQLTRHRHFSFSAESASFVDKSDHQVIPGNSVQEHLNSVTRKKWNGGNVTTFLLNNEIDEAVDSCMEVYRKVYGTMIEAGKSRTEARRAARFILPQGISTSVVMTGNMRAWREFLEKRNSERADAEIRAVAQLILAKLTNIAPATFQDM
jgi:thymidylate synthase (FAD)